MIELTAAPGEAVQATVSAEGFVAKIYIQKQPPYSVLKKLPATKGHVIMYDEDNRVEFRTCNSPQILRDGEKIVVYLQGDRGDSIKTAGFSFRSSNEATEVARRIRSGIENLNAFLAEEGLV